MHKAGPYKINEQTYSRFVQQDEYIWDIDALYTYSKNLPVFQLELDSFINSQKVTWFQNENLMICHLIEHYRRVLCVDLSHPILLDPNGKILDGLHRIVRACLEEKKFIIAKKFEKMPPPSKIWRHP